MQIASDIPLNFCIFRKTIYRCGAVNFGGKQMVHKLPCYRQQGNNFKRVVNFVAFVPNLKARDNLHAECTQSLKRSTAFATSHKGTNVKIVTDLKFL
jgi:hypothetical protein